MADVMGRTQGYGGHLEQLLQSHPMKAGGDAEALLACVQACFDCAQTCIACADACLGEEHVRELVRCIRLNQDCANVCEATAKVLARQTAPDLNVRQVLLQACIAACHACGEECGRHAAMMPHCRVCAEACAACERACQVLLGAV